jgi:hypothetical protein
MKPIHSRIRKKCKKNGFYFGDGGFLQLSPHAFRYHEVSRTVE